jgi:hypothetical protein
MMDMWKEFVDQLTNVTLLRQAHQETIHDWGDNAPVTLIFSRIGCAVSDNFREFSHDERVKIFEIIEEGFNSNDEIISTSVATGLLESIFNKIFENSELSRLINPFLGSKSREYLIAWGAWADLK